MNLNRNIKQSPIIGLAGAGGGTASYILYGTKAGGGYEISRSLRFNDNDSAHLSRTPGVAGNQKKFTISTWIKRGEIYNSIDSYIWHGATSPEYTGAYFDQTGELEFRGYLGGFTWRLQTARKFRDPGAWYHIVFVFDSTDSTNADRLRLYVNGVRETEFNQAVYPSTDHVTGWNNNTLQYIGAYSNPSNYIDGYLADFYNIDGQALVATDFGELDDSGVWQPKRYTGGSFGTCGFHLTFSDNSNTTATTLGKDTSGQGNNWDPNGFLLTAGGDNDSLTDVPTNYGTDTGSGGEVRGNFCTWNPLDVAGGGVYTLSNGNLSFVRTNNDWKGIKGTMGVSSGKWYFETVIAGTYTQDLMFGICSTDVNVYTSATIQDDATERNKGIFIFCDNGKTQLDNNARANYSSSLSSGNTIGIAFDLDAGTAQFYKNGSGLGSVDISSSNIMNGTAVPFIVTYYAGTIYGTNFGQRAWYNSSSVPSGYKALCVQNLTDPTVPEGRKYFDAITWKGTGVGGDQTITGLNLETEADMVWSKDMDTAYHHNLWDNVRGFGLRNSYNIDQAFVDGNAYAGRIKSTTNTSITWENDGGTAWYDQNNDDYVAWVWDAGSSTTSYSVGQLNTTQYDTSQNFSGNTSNPTGAYGNASNAFDGSLSSHASPSYGNEMTYTNPSAGSYTIDTLEIYAQIYSTAATGELNGTNIMPQLATGTRKWWTINGFKGQTLNTFKWGPNSSNLEFQLGAIRINGKLLVDTGTSVTNIPELATDVRANPAAGFSIAKWSGASNTAAIAHGLSKPPEIQFVKDSNNNYAGVFVTTLLGNTTDYMYLNSYSSTSANFGARAPDYTSFVVGQSANSNYFTYSWHSVEGYSKMGTYVANGSSTGDGQFIYLGFRPKFFFLKNTQNGNSYCISDTARAPSNVVDNFLFPDDPMVETTDATYSHDILSNGIKIRGTYDGINKSGNTIIFMAFAEHPFKSSRAR